MLILLDLRAFVRSTGSTDFIAANVIRVSGYRGCEGLGITSERLVVENGERALNAFQRINIQRGKDIVGRNCEFSNEYVARNPFECAEVNPFEGRVVAKSMRLYGRLGADEVLASGRKVAFEKGKETK